MWRYFLRRFLRRDDRVNLKLDDITPVGHPFVKKVAIICLHQLKATAQFLIDPARHVLQPLRSEATAVAKATIHRNRVLVLKMLDDHVEQSDSPRKSVLSPAFRPMASKHCQLSIGACPLFSGVVLAHAGGSMGDER